MRNHRLTVCFAIGILLLLSLPLYTVQGQNYFEYNVQVRGDGSAVWSVTQFSNVNATVESWDGFQQRVFDLVDAAASVTHREMAIDEASLQINTTISAESKITEYSFVWQNFSTVQGSVITFGDIFQVNNFFGQLYGDAALQVNYPSNYNVVSVNPSPYQRQDAAQTLRWSRTQDLTGSGVHIVLISNSPDANASTSRRQYGFVVLVLAVATVLSIVGFVLFRRRRRNGIKAVANAPVASSLDSEEDKVIKLLKSVGGIMRQSEITERCRFSKAKTSQLLSALESKGILARYKKGRDKIVTLKERVKGE
jgi:uncharacterized membrane protein